MPNILYRNLSLSLELWRCCWTPGSPARRLTSSLLPRQHPPRPAPDASSAWAWAVPEPVVACLLRKGFELAPPGPNLPPPEPPPPGRRGRESFAKHKKLSLEVYSSHSWTYTRSILVTRSYFRIVCFSAPFGDSVMWLGPVLGLVSCLLCRGLGASRSCSLNVVVWVRLSEVIAVDYDSWMVLHVVKNESYAIICSIKVIAFARSDDVSVCYSCLHLKVIALVLREQVGVR